MFVVMVVVERLGNIFLMVVWVFLIVGLVFFLVFVFGIFWSCVICMGVFVGMLVGMMLIIYYILCVEFNSILWFGISGLKMELWFYV